MKFHYTDLETCHDATGVVIVIDVIRAFTNAAFAFSRGAKEIYPVSKIKEALQLKAQIPDSLVCGEEGGLPPEGFDFGNSPTQTNVLDLSGRVIVQRTGAGTQGIVRSVNAEHMLAASMVVANATVRSVTASGCESRLDGRIACPQKLNGRKPPEALKDISTHGAMNGILITVIMMSKEQRPFPLTLRVPALTVA
jgi:phosphosulfolactate phosphohydrolase-like enzyme